MKPRACFALLPLALAAADCTTHPLLDPTCWTLKAPTSFNVSWTFGKLGSINVNVQRKWSPFGVDRFYNLVKFGYFSSEFEPDNNAGMFRVVPGFVVQFGIAGNASVGQASENAVIPNDPVILSNIRGTISYAAIQDPTTGQATNRTTQVYINYADNSNLDALGFTPFGVIAEEDMKTVVDKVYSGYGQNPDQDSIYAQGDVYLRKNFPLLSYITATKVVEEEGSA